MTGRRADNQRSREEFAQARRHGLRRRHALKLLHLLESRSERPPGEPGPGDGKRIECNRCGDSFLLADIVEHISIAHPNLDPTR